MKRRELLRKSTAFGLLAAVPGPAFDSLSAGDAPASPLAPPAHGSIPVAFLLSEGAVVIDFCGPWEVFQDVSVPGRAGDAFRLYTVAETAAPIRASGGLRITPDYTFANAPVPKVVVIPAQRGRSEATLEWIRRSAKSADVTMSVCTGAFLLAKTGLLSGKSATTHHDGYRGLQGRDLLLLLGRAQGGVRKGSRSVRERGHARPVSRPDDQICISARVTRGC
jgi:putative intracellular protease/amidase